MILSRQQISKQDVKDKKCRSRLPGQTFLGFREETATDQLTSLMTISPGGSTHLSTYLTHHFLSSFPRFSFSVLPIYFLSPPVLEPKDNFLFTSTPNPGQTHCEFSISYFCLCDFPQEPHISLKLHLLSIKRLPSPDKMSSFHHRTPCFSLKDLEAYIHLRVLEIIFLFLQGNSKSSVAPKKM